VTTLREGIVDLLHVAEMGVYVAVDMLGGNLQRLPLPYRYTLHNLVGHPLMEVCYLLGEIRLGDLLHDMTLPTNDREDQLEGDA